MISGPPVLEPDPLLELALELLALALARFNMTSGPTGLELPREAELTTGWGVAGEPPGVAATPPPALNALFRVANAC